MVSAVNGFVDLAVVRRAGLVPDADGAISREAVDVQYERKDLTPAQRDALSDIFSSFAHSGGVDRGSPKPLRTVDPEVSEQEIARFAKDPLALIASLNSQESTPSYAVAQRVLGGIESTRELMDLWSLSKTVKVADSYAQAAIHSRAIYLFCHGEDDKTPLKPALERGWLVLSSVRDELVTALFGSSSPWYASMRDFDSAHRPRRPDLAPLLATLGAGLPEAHRESVHFDGMPSYTAAVQIISAIGGPEANAILAQEAARVDISQLGMGAARRSPSSTATSHLARAAAAQYVHARDEDALRTLEDAVQRIVDLPRESHPAVWEIVGKNRPHLAFALGQVASGAPAVSKRVLESLRKLEAKYASPDLLYRLSEAFLKAGDAGEARRLAERALEAASGTSWDCGMALAFLQYARTNLGPIFDEDRIKEFAQRIYAHNEEQTRAKAAEVAEWAVPKDGGVADYYRARAPKS
jgi:hypothetical protein